MRCADGWTWPRASWDSTTPIERASARTRASMRHCLSGASRAAAGRRPPDRAECARLTAEGAALREAEAFRFGVRRHPAAADRVDVPFARAVPDRIDARSAGRNERRGRSAGKRRRLPDPVDDSFRQGAGVEGRACAERRRRLHPVGHGDGSREEIEEERRLLYVAMTRAKETLDLISPQRFFVRQQGPHGDRHVYALRSRFIRMRSSSCSIVCVAGRDAGGGSPK